MTLPLFMCFSQEEKNGVTNVRQSQLNLVDLAGSERQKDTNTLGIRLKVSLLVSEGKQAFIVVLKRSWSVQNFQHITPCPTNMLVIHFHLSCCFIVFSL